MDGEIVALQPLGGADQAFVRGPARLIDLGAHVDADEDEVQVDADTHAPVGGDGVEGEVAALEPLVFPQVPYVTDIGKKRSFQFPDDREAVFDVRFQLEVARLAGNQEVLVGLHVARSQRAGLPAAHAVRAAGVELFFERNRGGVAVAVTGADQEPESHRLRIVAKADGLAQLQFTADILGIRNVPDGVLPRPLVRRHRGVEEADDVAGDVEIETAIMVGTFGNGRRVRRVVQHAAHAHIEVVREGVHQEDISMLQT